MARTIDGSDTLASRIVSILDRAHAELIEDGFTTQEAGDERA